MTGENRRTNYTRGFACAGLLLLLAISGYAGAKREPVRTVNVDVTRSVFEMNTVAVSAEDAAIRLAADREKEIALLEDVVSNGDVSEETRNHAAVQITQIAQRMDMEAQSTAMLAHMGYDEAAVVCGLQMMTVFLPYETASVESDKTRILESVSSLTGVEAADIKIIITKK